MTGRWAGSTARSSRCRRRWRRGLLEGEVPGAAAALATRSRTGRRILVTLAYRATRRRAASWWARVPRAAVRGRPDLRLHLVLARSGRAARPTTRVLLRMFVRDEGAATSLPEADAGRGGARRRRADAADLGRAAAGPRLALGGRDAALHRGPPGPRGGDRGRGHGLARRDGGGRLVPRRRAARLRHAGPRGRGPDGGVAGLASAAARGRAYRGASPRSSPWRHAPRSPASTARGRPSGSRLTRHDPRHRAGGPGRAQRPTMPCATQRGQTSADAVPLATPVDAMAVVCRDTGSGLDPTRPSPSALATRS